MTKSAKVSKLPPALCPHARNSAKYLSTELGNKVSLNIWTVVQRGLVYPAPHAIFMMCWKVSPALTYDVLCNLLTEVRHYIHRHLQSQNTTVVVGFGFDLWQEWCKEQGFEIPQGMSFAYPSSQNPSQSSVVEDSHGVFANSAADILFHIKSDAEQHCREVHNLLVQKLEVELQCITSESQEVATKSNRPDKMGGKVLGCRFSENLMNPSDPVTMEENVIIGFEDPKNLGGSFMMVQRFLLIWENLLNMSTTEFQDLVGRTFDDVMIPSDHIRSHIKCARVQSSQGDTMPVLRLGLPFGKSPAVDTDDGRQKGASLRDEEGLYFAGLAKSARILEEVMHSQVGDNPTFSMRDSLLSNVRANLGGFFYIPNLVELKQELLSIPGRLATKWVRFPGVDWSRLDRHYQLRSANGYMYYNHQDYLYAMGTMVGKDRHIYLPPSNRVLRTLTNVFSRWQDNWYFNRAQPELEPLHTYVTRYFDKETADTVMQLSVAERMGWAIRMGVGHVFVSHEYGFRGRKKTMTGYISGADTYRIHPAEIIVGALPNLGLGQGRYVIDYTREDEKLQGYFTGITFASGIGHVIPDYQRALDKGISGLMADIHAKLAAETETSKQEFYKGIRVSLLGVQEHCHAYARLAREMVNTLGSGQIAERLNLEEIAARMDRLADEKPQTMLEAAQLIFTLHSCLHLTGEPTAIGRLDQLLFPFYTADIAAGVLDEDHSQEIIDCFWIKVGEKVQLNRFYVEDHQPYGNLAMGGSSGNYPQGAGNNQWVQQITVGGTVASNEDGDGQPAYNAVTKLCLRAARRLPLNAPCLSLRMRKDIPDEYLQEATLAILSGGSHPFLINDEKIIAGLLQSGERIGEGSKPTQYTPVAQKAGDCWSSSVDITIARDYACDGCFEPQLTACNWFTLGGFVTLSALEAALNQGKTWATAGPIYFRGQRVSLTTIPPKQIQTFEHLLDLFFNHLKWMYSKDVDNLLSVFGDMASQCPAPLLSLLTNDCLEKGLDIYGGGARYNVIAPCFTGLPNTINSLYAIKQLVFNKDTAMTSLPELVQCLINNWGYSMQEPFVNVLQGPGRIEGQAESHKLLREVALALPRYGRGNADIDAFGDMIIQRMSATVASIFTDPVESTAKKMVELAKKLGTSEKPFGGFQIQPGAGTFENYVEFGSTCGASADGRLNGQPLASNISPTPSPADKVVQPQYAIIDNVVDGYTGKGSASVWSGAPTDLNIVESHPAEELKETLKSFAGGAGSNILTITCANPETLEGAAKNPEKYDLLRTRMGGWSEFMVAMFPAHQAQHERRPRDTAAGLQAHPEPVQSHKRKRN